MKYILHLLVAGALAGLNVLCAQNFSGGDNFSGVVFGNWSGDTTSTGGAFTVSGGVLNFTDGGLTTYGQSSSAQRSWTLNAGSYAADWQVQVDFTLNLSQVASQVTYLEMSLVNNANTTDSAKISFQQSYMTASVTRNIFGAFYTNGSGGIPAQMSATPTTITVRASYVVASHQITLDYNAGSGFSTLTGATIDSGGLNWGMNPSDTFGLSLLAANTTNAGATGSVTTGVSADNFFASGTAIPESSTYAALFGLAALGFAVYRRKKSA